MFGGQVGRGRPGGIRNRDRARAAAETFFRQCCFQPRIKGSGQEDTEGGNAGQQPQRLGNSHRQAVEYGLDLRVNEAALFAKARIGCDDLAEGEVRWQARLREPEALRQSLRQQAVGIHAPAIALDRQQILADDGDHKSLLEVKEQFIPERCVCFHTVVV